MNSRPIPRKRARRQSPLILVLLLITLILAVAVVVLIIKYNQERAALDAMKETPDTAVFSTETGFSDTGEEDILQQQLRELTEKNTELEKIVSELESEKQQLSGRLSLEESKNSNFDEQLENLSRELDVRTAELEAIRKSIEELSKALDLNLTDQLKIFTDISNLLANPLPIEKIVEEEDEEGNIIERIEQIEPKIALCYQDIKNGYTYSFNASAVLDPASMIKAPYILSLLIAASEEEKMISELREAAAEAKPDEPFEEPERLFDMTRTIIYTKDEYFQSGTGEISRGEEETEYTYLELFYHVLECSDNVAYAILREEYGTEIYSKYVLELRAPSLLGKGNGMSAADAVKIMNSIYEFIESEAYYAAFMKDAMINSKHTVLIPYSVSPHECAHKYGWDTDSYCDMGVVYADRPYAVAILTNYDTGSREVNEYLQAILRKINALHSNLSSMLPAEEEDAENGDAGREDAQTL